MCGPHRQATPWDNCQPLVVTRDESGQVELGGPATRIVPGWQFLLENDAAE